MPHPSSSSEPIVLVTSATPYANGPLHLGHVVGVYLPTDIYTRHLRMRGVPTVMVCGSDDHGVAIEISATREGMTEEALTARYRQMFIDALGHLDIHFDTFSRTHAPHHMLRAVDFFETIQRNGFIERRREDMAYCEDCHHFLPDRYVEGTCPYCGEDGARGDQCEKCSKLLAPHELIRPVCKMCGSHRVVTRETYNYFFLLSKLQKPLEDWIATKADWKPNVLGTAQKWLREGLEDRAISRDIRWGIPIPGEESKKLYVWFEACIAYISHLEELGERRDDPTLADRVWRSPDSRIVHFIGKDNIVFHTIIWPALLMAYNTRGAGETGIDYHLPDDVPGNEFMNLEGEKLSKSRNHAVWLHEIVEKFSPDALRYYLTYCIPERKDSNFMWDEFRERNNELANVFGNLVNRITSFTLANFNGEVSRPDPALLSDTDRAIPAAVVRTRDEMVEHLDHYQFREGLKTLFLLIQDLNRYLNERAPWTLLKTDRDSAKAVVDTVLVALIEVAILARPYLPATSDTILGAFGIDGTDIYRYDHIGNLPVDFPRQVSRVDILFRKLEESDTREEQDKLARDA